MTYDNSKNLICEQISNNDSLQKLRSKTDVIKNTNSKIKLIYFTDPICSFCWAIEPQFRKFKLDYQQHIEVEYRLGGLLKNWDRFKDGNNGITCPMDVAEHWEEVAKYSDMSIDGDVWINSPLSSSYPSSIAYKALLNQSSKVALNYLRIVREMLFLEKRDISDMKYILEAVTRSSADVNQFIQDFKNPKSEEQFLGDIQMGKDMGIKGFPTFIFVNDEGLGFKLFGASEYDSYVQALEKALGKKVAPIQHSFTEKGLVQTFKKLSTKEISILMNQQESETLNNLESLYKVGEIEKLQYKNGVFWAQANL